MKVIIRNAEQLAEAKAELADLKKAWRKTLNAQSYTIGSDQLNRASLKRIEEEISDYVTAIDEYETGGCTGRRTLRVVPVD